MNTTDPKKRVSNLPFQGESSKKLSEFQVSGVRCRVSGECGVVRVNSQPSTVNRQQSTNPKSNDPNRVLRLLPLVAGGLGGLLLLINRILTSQLVDSQARSDALGVILSALLILIGLLWQQIQPKPPDAVELSGQSGFELQPNLPDFVNTELAWASHLLLTNTVTKTLLVFYNGQVLLRRGILSQNPEVKIGPIVQRVLDKQKPIYLVNLALYPGRVEFDYLPENTQGIICQPIGKQGVLILGANAPRSYTRQDEKWIEGIADKLADSLERFSLEADEKTV